MPSERVGRVKEIYEWKVRLIIFICLFIVVVVACRPKSMLKNAPSTEIISSYFEHCDKMLLKTFIYIFTIIKLWSFFFQDGPFLLLKNDTGVYHLCMFFS